jgi:hypothetical protein
LSNVLNKTNSQHGLKSMTSNRDTAEAATPAARLPSAATEQIARGNLTQPTVPDDMEKMGLHALGPVSDRARVWRGERMATQRFFITWYYDKLLAPNSKATQSRRRQNCGASSWC